MKKALALAVALLARSTLAQGYPEEPRRLELTPFAGFFWSTQISTSQGYITTNAAPDFGGTLDLSLGPTSQLELLYAYAGTQSRFYSEFVATPGSGWFDVKFQYFQIGGTTTFPQGALEPFISGSLGAVWIAPSDPVLTDGRTVDLADTWLFAFSVGGGLKWFLSRALGLRLQARVFLPILLESGAFYSGPGGSAFAVNGGIPLVQGDLSVGLVLAP
jgi:hypothetical protein